jgi:ABC-type bacteriocin/lantibiotic exporter with double-glycine peptidase domain
VTPLRPPVAGHGAAPGLRVTSVFHLTSVAVWLCAFLQGGCAVRQTGPRRVLSDPAWTVVPTVKLVAAQDDNDCGAAALETVVAYWKPGLDTVEFRTNAVRSSHPADGFEAGQLQILARRQGLNAFLIEAKMEDLVYEIRRGRPVIIGVVTTRLGRPYGHYEVVTGVTQAGDRVLVADPRGAWRQVDIGTLTAQWRPSRQLALIIFP